MTLGGRLSLAAACLAGSALITWAIYDPDSLAERNVVEYRRVESAAPGADATLWLMSVGVSEYLDPELSLRFADDDAVKIAEALSDAAGGGRYREVRSLVLTNDEVTRESLLDGLANFLGEAGPNDVAVLFFAGHGVRDLSSGSYYFLPHPARSETLLTDGLRMTDFDEMLRIVRRNVRAVVVMLDTCHAGAMGASPGQVVSADEMAAQMSAGEGFFLLAASRPGEESKEQHELGHGAFTYSILEALSGQADGDGDGALSVSEMFGYVAKRVPSLTGGQQHPYSKTEGTDLILVSTEVTGTPAVARERSLPLVSADHVPPPAEPDVVAGTNSIAVLEFENLRRNQQFNWISKALRVAFDTELSKVRALKVFSPELMDHTTRIRGADSLYTARELGVARLVTGAFHVTGQTLRIDARIIDAGTGVNEASDSVEGELDDFFHLQKQLVLSMLRRLRVQVSAAEDESIQTETNTDVDAYRLLLESEGLLPAPTTAEDEPESRTDDDTRHGWLDWLTTAAYAQDDLPTPDADPPPSQEEIEAFLEGLRSALEAEDVERVAGFYVTFSDRQRAALQAYMNAADNLSIELSDVEVEREAGTTVVSFTRRDRFDDRKTGREVKLEVRLTKILADIDGNPRIGATP